MALTSDFTGTYDYEKVEAAALADSLLTDLADGYYTLDQYRNQVTKEAAHWKRILGETFSDFAAEFNRLTASTNVAMQF